MLKFLRKYKTWILVVGGTLLMIAFLLPSGFSKLPAMSGSGTFMKIDGHKVSMTEFAHAARERQVVIQVAPGMLDAFGIQQEVDHWLLLVHAAEELGLVGGPDDGRDYIPDLAAELTTASLRRPINYTDPKDLEQIETRRLQMEERARMVGGQLRMQDREVYQALSKFRGIVRMYALYASMGEAVSAPRLALEARRRLDQGVIDYVFLPATSFTHTVDEPTPEQIAAHFEKYRDVETGQGDFGLGYRFGPRFQIEWIALNRSTLSSGLTVSPVDVRKAFMQENPSGTDEQFQAARAEIELRLKNAQIDKVMEEAAATVRAEIAKSLRKFESNGQYRELPADWMDQRPNYDAISGAVVSRLNDVFGVAVAAPPVTRRNDAWLTQANLTTLPGIGQATIRRGSRSGGFSQYVMSIKELAGPSDIGLQVGVPGEAVLDRVGNMYFFTVTGYKPAGPAETAEEIQTQLVSDLKRVAAFEKLKVDADAYRQQAIAGGLEPLAKPPEGSSAAMPLTVRRNIGVTRTDTLYMDQVLNADETKTAIMDAVVKLDPKVDLSSVDLSQRTITLPIADRLGLAVIMIKGYNATTTEASRTRDTGLARSIGSVELRDAMTAITAAATDGAGEEPFSLSALAKRYNAELSAEHKTMEERRAKEEAEAAAATPGGGTPAKPAAPKPATIGR